MTDWKPGAQLTTLRSRAALVARIREFFAAREVLEVETPLLARDTTTAPHIESLEAEVFGRRRYLQTSPEHAMKRLLAAGSGPIYQLGKAFRAGEKGSRHNVEFTLLEWYRPGLDAQALMDEVGALLVATLGCRTPERKTYREVFHDHVRLDPHRASAGELEAAYRSRKLPAVEGSGLDRADWLDLLMSSLVEPALPEATPLFVHDYPVELAANARLRERPGEPAVAERFELYFHGMELANGYDELTDAAAQRSRAEAEQAKRRQLGRSVPPIDERLLEALASGLPRGAGVALGFDRLVMIATGARRIDEVVSFVEE